MPSQTFLNLPKEKQNKLISCAMKEFSKRSFNEVSINKIITDASISRGSFYMYFSDKEDLFEYLLESHRQKLGDVIKKNFCINSGDLRESFIGIFDSVVDWFINYEDLDFFKNTYMYMNSKTEKYIRPHNLFVEIRQYINTDKLKNVDLELLFDMFMQNLISSIVKVIIDNGRFNRDEYIKRIDLICYGIYREVCYV